MKTWEEFRAIQFTERIDGQYVETVVIEEPTWLHVRNYRDWRLQDSDVSVLVYTEKGLPVPIEWLQYRQALRDITATYDDPADVCFPDKPDIPFPKEFVSQDDRLQAAETLINLILDEDTQ